MDKMTNTEGMTPHMDRPTTGGLMGDIFRALTEHGFALEQQIDSLRNGNRALQYAQRHSEEAAGKAERTVDEQARRLGVLEALALDAFTIIGKAYDEDSENPEWRAAVEKWASRWLEAFPAEANRSLTDDTPLPGVQPAQTDAGPTEGGEGTSGPNPWRVPTLSVPTGVVPTCTPNNHYPMCGHKAGAAPRCTKEGHLTGTCEHAPDGGNHPTTPSAG